MRTGGPIDGRRLFFRSLAREAMVLCEEVGGRRHVKFEDLPKLPPGEIATLVPQICPGVQIVREGDRVSARMPGATESVALFPSDQANQAAFDRFNGQNSIARVAAEVSIVMSWPRQQSLDHVKGLFFRLVRLRVCAPANKD